MSNVCRSLGARIGIVGALLLVAFAFAPRADVAAEDPPPTCDSDAPAIQWAVADGGNGHWYQRLCTDAPISWLTAQTNAELQGRYLATLASAAENEWVTANVIMWCGCNHWAGGMQEPDQDNPGDSWSWVNGEGAFLYVNWNGSSEPNDQDPEDVAEDNEENCLEVSEMGFWNDQNCGPNPDDLVFGQLVEWEETAAATCDTLPGDISDANVIVGTNGSNILTGTSGKDAIFGLGGNDIIRGLGDDDLLCGGEGNDILLGGTGNDRAEGGAGNDTVTGDAGDDALFGDAGNDVITGSSGTNTIDGGTGWDVCASPTIGPNVTGCFP